MACKINFDLGNGVKMPVLGYGTWQAPSSELEPALNAALDAGYRHIDCAYVYENEDCVGDVLSKWIASGKGKREDLFIVTKLPITGSRPASVEKYLRKSLANLKVDYIDLYLIHTPMTFQERGDELHPHDENGLVLLEKNTDHVRTWKEMERLCNAGLIKSIGLSNFNQTQIDRLLPKCTIKPAVLQIELHAYFQQKELTAYCAQKGIKITCYSPLGSKGLKNLFKALGINKEIPDIMANPVITAIAQKLNVSPAQVLLRFLIQKGYSAIPKSTNPERLRKNIDIFSFVIPEDDMKQIEGLDQGPKARLNDFSFFKGIKEHPEFPF